MSTGSMAEALAKFALAAATQYGMAKGMALSTIGLRAIGDGTFFTNMAEGEYSRYTLRRLDRAIAWLHCGWPDGAKWPSPPKWPYPRPNECIAATRSALKRLDDEAKARGQVAGDAKARGRTVAEVRIRRQLKHLDEILGQSQPIPVDRGPRSRADYHRSYQRARRARKRMEAYGEEI